MEKKEIEELSKYRKTLEILGVKDYTDSGLSIMKLVSNELSKMKLRRPIISKTEFSRDQIITTGISTLKIYDSSVLERVHKTFSSKPFMLMKEQGTFKTHINFDVEKDEDDNFVINKESGQVDHFKISTESYLSDIIWYGHEGIHACKDTNYEEYINACRFGDVIPLFHELITSLNLNGKVFNEWINTRFYFLQENVQMVRETLRQKSKDKKYSNLYDIKIGGAGQYLVSYYYATILFEMYLENPKLILDIVNKVLKGEKTTEEILTELNIINPISDLNNSFYVVNSQFQKLLKK